MSDWYRKAEIAKLEHEAGIDRAVSLERIKELVDNPPEPTQKLRDLMTPSDPPLSRAEVEKIRHLADKAGYAASHEETLAFCDTALAALDREKSYRRTVDAQAQKWMDDAEERFNAKIRALTEERDRAQTGWNICMEAGEALQARRDRLREALERIDGMAGRPKCLCGRPTGTPAIRQCARAALEAEDGSV